MVDPSDASVDVANVPDEETQRSLVADDLVGVLAGLPPPQREVLLLAHYEQLSLAEIGEILQVEITAVKSRLQRARATLRETLAAYAPRTESTI